MWIAYGSNRIGYNAAWVDARSSIYTLPAKWVELIKKYRIPPYMVNPNVR